MVKLNSRYFYYLVCLIVITGSSCKNLHLIDEIPLDTYQITPAQYNKLHPNGTQVAGQKTVQVGVEQSDSILKIIPVAKQLKPLDLKLENIDQIKFHRNTLDIDVLTVPFKIRPSVQGFPEQLDANFDAALYIGRRRDNYSIEKTKSRRSLKPRIAAKVMVMVDL